MGWWSTGRPVPPPRCWRCGATASPCSARGTRTPGSPPGPASCRPWPGRDPTCTGSSGSSPACPTTAARCVGTGPAMPCSAPIRRPAALTGPWSTRRHRSPGAIGSWWRCPSTRPSRRGRSGPPGGGLVGVGAVLEPRDSRPPPGARRRRHLRGGRARPEALARVIAETCAPIRASRRGVAPTGSTRATPIPSDPRRRRHRGAGPAWPWPMAVEPQWDAVRTDGTWHATYWIAEWPRVDVTPDFLGPLLFSPAAPVGRQWSMEPVSPSRAARQVAQARTADLADGELRRRGGFLVTARHTREKESVERPRRRARRRARPVPVLGLRDGDRRQPPTS